MLSYPWPARLTPPRLRRPLFWSCHVRVFDHVTWFFMYLYMYLFMYLFIYLFLFFFVVYYYQFFLGGGYTPLARKQQQVVKLKERKGYRPLAFQQRLQECPAGSVQPTPAEGVQAPRTQASKQAANAG